MKFFVTGVGGQLGHDLMNELLKRGYEGVGSDIKEHYSGVADGSTVMTVPYVQLDITDKAAVEKVIIDVNPDKGNTWPKFTGEYRGSASAEGDALEDGTNLNLSDKE